MRFLQSPALDKKTRLHYLSQPLVGVLLLSLIMFSTDFLLSETVVASFGATLFIVTTMPQSKSIKPRYLLGGYSCGIAAGLLGALLKSFTELPVYLIAAIAVMLAIILMVGLELEHPPAGALALGIVLAPNPLVTAAIALCGIIAICTVFNITKRWMINLM